MKINRTTKVTYYRTAGVIPTYDASLGGDWLVAARQAWTRAKRSSSFAMAHLPGRSVLFCASGWDRTMVERATMSNLGDVQTKCI